MEPIDENTGKTAVREVLEEAGVIGRLGRCLGVFEVIMIDLLKAYNDFHILNVVILEPRAQAQD